MYRTCKMHRPAHKMYRMYRTYRMYRMYRTYSWDC